MKIAWPVAVVAFALGVLWCALTLGRAPFDVANDAWLRQGDWAWHHLGWLYYRDEPWRFPPGKLELFPWGTGTTVGYIDGMPIVAMLCKALRSLLPAGFHYLGPWLVLSFGLQAVCGAELAAIATSRRVLQVLGGALFAVAPPLLFRIGHVALMTQWVLVALLVLNLRPIEDERAARRAVGWAAVLLLFVAGIHPYLTVMSFTLFSALLYRIVYVERRLAPRTGLRALGLTLLGIAAMFFLGGYFDGTGMGADGWRVYSANVLSLVDPMGRSALLPNLPSREGQYEGFGYLGAGALLLSIVGVVLARKGPPRAVGIRPVLVACLACALYSLSTRVAIGRTVIFDSSFEFFRLAEAFQSSGRFIWPMHYLIVGLALCAVLKHLEARPLLAGALLVAAVGLTALEPRLIGVHLVAAPPSPYVDARWSLARGTYRRLLLYPASLGCSDALPHVDGPTATRLGYLAHSLGMQINSAALSRVPCDRQRSACAAFHAEVAAGHLDDDAIYVVYAQMEQSFPRAHARCARLDGTLVCVAARANAFADALGEGVGAP